MVIDRLKALGFSNMAVAEEKPAKPAEMKRPSFEEIRKFEEQQKVLAAAVERPRFRRPLPPPHVNRAQSLGFTNGVAEKPYKVDRKKMLEIQAFKAQTLSAAKRPNVFTLSGVDRTPVRAYVPAQRRAPAPRRDARTNALVITQSLGKIFQRSR